MGGIAEQLNEADCHRVRAIAGVSQKFDLPLSKAQQKQVLKASELSKAIVMNGDGETRIHFPEVQVTGTASSFPGCSSCTRDCTIGVKKLVP